MIQVCNAPTVARQDYELASMTFTPALRVATALLPPLPAPGLACAIRDGRKRSG